MSSESSTLIVVSPDQHWLMAQYDNSIYAFIDLFSSGYPLVRTPGGVLVSTRYRALADRIFADLQKYGPKRMSSNSILPWHYTMCENFAKMEQEDVVKMLDRCFLQKDDWTYPLQRFHDWYNVVGDEETRKAEIRKWLSKCTHMQLTAACCIGNAFESINVAYVLAVIMENFQGTERKNQMARFAELIGSILMYGEKEDILVTFNNFELYYGIHLKEDGPIIGATTIKI